MEQHFTFADRLLEYMKIKSMSKSELARKLNVNPSQITRYCSGESEPNKLAIDQISSKLGVSVEWLFGRDVPMENLVIHEDGKTHKSIALEWIRNEASKDELVEFIHEATDLLRK